MVSVQGDSASVDFSLNYFFFFTYWQLHTSSLQIFCDFHDNLLAGVRADYTVEVSNGMTAEQLASKIDYSASDLTDALNIAFPSSVMRATGVLTRKKIRYVTKDLNGLQ